MTALEEAGDNRLPSSEAAARVVLDFHAKWRGFRRALRHLSIVKPKVRAARTAARRTQMKRLAEFSGRRVRSDAQLVAALLKAERLCDAAAEGELADLGISPSALKLLVAQAMDKLFGRPRVRRA